MYLLDYLGSEFSSFDEVPFGPVDSAALSQVCMVRAEGLVPALDETKRGRLAQAAHNLLPRARATARFVDLLRAERYADMFTGLAPARVKDNLLALAASPRFRELELHEYAATFDVDAQTQFAALTFSRGKDFSYVGFRGTDTTITGWRENFNMACNAEVPAQRAALAYLEAVARRTKGRLIVGGHSKGANLAAYAALKASDGVQERIARVYLHDGPGFKEGAVSDEEWARLAGRIHRTVPQESVVGMLMECPVPAHVVRATSHGFDQHSPFTWEIEGADFVYADKLADSSQLFDTVMTEWLSQYSDEEAAAIVDALFKAVEASGTTNASAIFFSGLKIVPLITRAAQNIDEGSRAVLTAALGSLAEITARNAGKEIMERFGGRG